MFGYVTVVKELMSEEDYLDFSGYYCGVCKAAGENCSQLSRLGLSYDITFLAVVLSSVSEKDVLKCEERCIAHWFKKRRRFKKSRAIDYAANMGVMLFYLKLRDDWRDEKSVKALAGMLALYRGMRRARKQYGGEYNAISAQLAKLGDLEKQGCENIDETADCFAKILEALFTPDFITDTNTRRILKWLGYNTGRWIYVIDAVNDMEKDYRKKSYNTLNTRFENGDFGKFKEEIIENQRVNLTFTLENIASSFELLEIFKNRGVLEHIIYKSLILRQNKILENKNGSV